MARFTKKPVTIDAILAGEVMDGASSGRFSPKTLRNGEELMPAWVIDAFEKAVFGFQSGPEGAGEVILINTEGHGQVTAQRTDWIIRGVNGELYPCRPDVFEKTYEPGDGSQVLTVKGDITREQFEEFKRKYNEDIFRGSRAIVHDAEPNGDLLDTAWGIIANAGGGNWSLETPAWQEAARRWRDEYHKTFSDPTLAAGAAQLIATIPTVQLSGNVEVEVNRDGVVYKIEDQPPPKSTDLVPCWEQVIVDFRSRYALSALARDVSPAIDPTDAIRDVLDDMTARDATGRERYGVPLTAYNGRDQIIDAYQEMLDGAVYLRAAIEEGLNVRTVYERTLDDILWLRTFINGRRRSS